MDVATKQRLAAEISDRLTTLEDNLRRQSEVIRRLRAGQRELLRQLQARATRLRALARIGRRLQRRVEEEITGRGGR